MYSVVFFYVYDFLTILGFKKVMQRECSSVKVCLSKVLT